MAQSFLRLGTSVLPALLACIVVATPSFAEIAPDVRDRVLPAAVQIAIVLQTTEDGVTRPEYVPVGSGTVVSPSGLILTNWHVVDAAAYRAELDAWDAQAARDGASLSLVLDESRFLVLSSASGDLPEPAYIAQVVAEHHALDLAVLQVVSNANGQPIDATPLTLPFLPIGDSAAVRQGDAVHVFGYPAAGGGTLQYTGGVVSGFNFADGIDGRAWITTDATMSGGSSGGTAVNDAGELVGVPTQGSALDCRPGDTNFDGRIDAEDVGCIPTGGAFGQLRPVALALPILASAGFALGTIEAAGAGTGAVAPTHESHADAIDAAPADPSSSASYVYAEDWCRSGPVYPPGTMIELPRPVQGRSLPIASVEVPATALSYAYLPYRPFLPSFSIPAGTVVEIAGPYVENGVCDLWPVRYRTTAGVEKEAYLDEWDLSPVFPNQVAPLPPERQSVTGEMEGFCRSNPSYAEGEVLVVGDESPLYSHRRGYPFNFLSLVAAGTEVEITGPPTETGVCDMWPVTYVIPGAAPSVAEGELTEEEAIYGPVAGADWDEAMSAQDRVVEGYIHESDLRPGGN